MKKRFYRLGGVLTALMLMLSMTLSMSSTVFAAAGDDGTKDDTGTITVSGITDANAGGSITVTAYPIILAYYNESGNFVDYVSLYSSYINFDSSTDTNGNIIGFAVDESDLDAIRNELYNSGTNSYSNTITFGSSGGNTTWSDGTTTYIVGNSAASSYQLTYDQTTQSYSAEVAVGSYLIIVSGAEAVNYNEAVVSAYYDENRNVTDGSVAMNDDTNNTWLKATTPSVDKTIAKVTDYSTSTATDVNKDYASANIGDTVSYKIAVSPIPNYGGTNPVFNVTDILDGGLTLDESSIRVYVVNPTGTQTVVLETGETAITRSYRQTITKTYDQTSGELTSTSIYITFVLSSALDSGSEGYRLNSYEGWTLYIEYDATLNANAELNGIANENDATLVYSTDSRVSGATGNANDGTYVYTFDIDGATTGTLGIITKYGEKEESTQGGVVTADPLEGAEFTLYTDATCTTVYTNSTFNGTVTSDSSGQLNITGLAAGTYYLKETKAPNGYTQNSTVYQVQIQADYNQDGTINAWVVIISDADNPSGTTSTFTVSYQTGSAVVTGSVNGTSVYNTKTTGLPNTGAYGTLLFTLIGCAVMIVSAAAYIRCRDKKSK